MTLSGNLWQVGHADNLAIVSQRAQWFANYLGGTTAYADIYFVKYQGGVVDVCATTT